MSNKLEKEINKINKNELLELIENVKKHKKTSYDFNNKLNFLNTDNLQDSLRQSESKKKLNNDTTVLNLTTNNNSYRANNLTDRQSVFESKSIKNIKSTISTNINSPSKSKLITHINENYKSNNSISNNYLNTNQENRTNTNNSKNKNNYQTFFKTVELSSNINKNTHNKFNNFTAAGKQISSDYFAKNDIPSLENFFKGFKMNYSEDRNSIISNGRRSDIGFNTNRLKHLTKSNEIKYNTNDLETPIKISKKNKPTCSNYKECLQ